MREQINSRFLEFIREKHLVQKGDRLLLAVSGGSDSMVLSDLFYSAGFELGIAHCNFKLRGADSDRDELFVKKFALEKEIPFYVKVFDTKGYAAKRHISIEVAARELRYAWFEKIRKQFGYTSIATAHHQNDNVETLLLNFFKGTGIRGLHGIRPRNGKIIRPILFLSKTEIWNYIELHDIAYVEDVTNVSREFTRNYLRHQIIPELGKRFPNFVHTMNDNIQRFSEAEALYDQALQEHRKQLLKQEGAEVYIPILKLKKSRPLSTIAYEIFKDYNFSFEQSQQIIRLMNSTSGRVIYSATHRLIRDRKWLIISPLSSGENRYFIITEKDTKITGKEVSLFFSKKNADGFKIPTGASVAALDIEKIHFPLVLRKWKQGDYFYPLGMPKKKKLSRFFIDQKLSLLEKEKVWVLLSGERVLWVVGMRIDNRFKITENTRQVLLITSHLKS